MLTHHNIYYPVLDEPGEEVLVFV